MPLDYGNRFRMPTGKERYKEGVFPFKEEWIVRIKVKNNGKGYSFTTVSRHKTEEEANQEFKRLKDDKQPN